MTRARASLAAGALWIATWALAPGRASGGDVPRRERSPGDIAIELAGQGAFSKQEPGWVPEMQARMEPMRLELDALKAELEALTASYPGLKDLEAARRERSELRARLIEKRGRLAELLALYRGRQGADMLVSIRQTMRRKGGTGMEKTLEGFFSKSGFGMAVSIALDAARTALEKEEAAFASAEAALARRRADIRAGAACAVFLLLGGAAYALRGRRRPPAAVPSEPGAPASAPAHSAPACGSAAAVSAPAAGPVGGNFQLERELGDDGGVFEAVDLVLKRRVVLKALRPELSRSPRELERFLAEARRVASLEHARVAKLHGFTREGGSLYLIFEYVPGESLARMLQARLRLPLSDAVEILDQAGAALDYAHGQGILHQALTPSNILIAGGRDVKVSDFSLARLSRLTAGRISGASSPRELAYLAPEAELGEACAASDVFSLAVCFYEMLSGRPPFPGPNFLAHKRDRRFAPLSSAGLPARLDAVLSRALSTDPAQRHRRACELGAGLREAASG